MLQSVSFLTILGLVIFNVGVAADGMKSVDCGQSGLMWTCLNDFNNGTLTTDVYALDFATKKVLDHLLWHQGSWYSHDSAYDVTSGSWAFYRLPQIQVYNTKSRSFETPVSVKNLHSVSSLWYDNQGVLWAVSTGPTQFQFFSVDLVKGVAVLRWTSQGYGNQTMSYAARGGMHMPSNTFYFAIPDIPTLFSINLNHGKFSSSPLPWYLNNLRGPVMNPQQGVLLATTTSDYTSLISINLDDGRVKTIVKQLPCLTMFASVYDPSTQTFLANCMIQSNEEYYWWSYNFATKQSKLEAGQFVTTAQLCPKIH
jgi:hypothetical protein